MLRIMGERDTIFSMIPKPSLGTHGDFKGEKNDWLSEAQVIKSNLQYSQIVEIPEYELTNSSLINC